MDGFLKFWNVAQPSVSAAPSSSKAMPDLRLELLRTVRAHASPILEVVASHNNQFVTSFGEDGSTRIFDASSTELLGSAQLNQERPSCACFLGDEALAIGSFESDQLLISSRESLEVIKTVTLEAPISKLCYSPVHSLLIVALKNGPIVSYSYSRETQSLTRLETTFDDLNETMATSMGLSPDNSLLAVFGADGIIRIFKTASGKLYRKYDESLSFYQRTVPEFDKEGREQSFQDEPFRQTQRRTSLLFDESGSFLLFPCPTGGIKVLNTVTNKLARIIGASENLRFISLAFMQGVRPLLSLQQASSLNPTLQDQSSNSDIFLFATAHSKNRFYIFSRSELEQDTERDVMNERLTFDKSSANSRGKSLPSKMVMRTTMGDIYLTLYPEYAPLAVENFVTLAKRGYYNGLLFHRVIKGFMIQSGDPLGDGTGGSSIWDKDFKDEFHPSLRHDQPYTLSMANAGKNTNGSQFFITSVKTPWLDDKHTIFGRVTKGKDVINRIEASPADKLDKPLQDIKIYEIEIMNE